MALPQFRAVQARLIAYLRNEPCRGQGWWPMLRGDLHGPRINVCNRCGLEASDDTRPERVEAADS